MTSVQNQGNQQIQALSQTHQPQQPQVLQPQAQPQIQQNYAKAPQNQTAAPPSYAGVNIQIYNPSVGVPNINPTGSAPASQSLPGIAYPQNYYTQQYGLPQASGNITAQGGQGGNAVVNNHLNPSPVQGVSDVNSTETTNKSSTTETTNTEKKESNKKTEKRKIVELSDDYIKNLENYLNSQDKEVRMMGAKEVIARLQEDDSRKDDPALTALINKMLQDPLPQIRVLALSMLDSRMCTGNDYTIGVLKKMQNSTSGYGQDAA